MKISCIYFMFLKGNLVYVGQTSNLRNRMRDHTYEFSHDCIRWILCPPDKLKAYEKRIIKILKPWWNSHHNSANIRSPYRGLHFKIKKPVWMYYYESISSIKAHLAFCPTLSRYEAEDLMHQLKKHELDFQFNYERFGYKGTILDTNFSINSNRL